MSECFFPFAQRKREEKKQEQKQKQANKQTLFLFARHIHCMYTNNGRRADVMFQYILK